MPPFRPNYAQQRGDRSRSKGDRKQEKLDRRREASETRKAARSDESGKGVSGEEPDSGTTDERPIERN